MLTKTTKITKDNYNGEILIKKGEVYLDIETTGLNKSYDHVTIIGYMIKENEDVYLHQLVDDTGSDEELLLKTLSSTIRKCNIVTHYNGTSFDIPFLKKRYQKHHLLDPFDRIVQNDLYACVKKYKSFISASNLKQKNIETYLGVYRNDQLSGEDVVKTYISYLATKDADSLSKILLHNHEDVIHLMTIRQLEKIETIKNGEFNIVDAKIISKDYPGITDDTKSDTLSNPYVLITLMSDYSLPFTLNAKFLDNELITDGQMMKLYLPITEGYIKYYYHPYKDYFYLPYEDKAIHKSIATYVDKSSKRKATIDTCYDKKIVTEELLKNNAQLKVIASSIINYM